MTERLGGRERRLRAERVAGRFLLVWGDGEVRVVEERTGRSVTVEDLGAAGFWEGVLAVLERVAKDRELLPPLVLLLDEFSGVPGLGPVRDGVVAVREYLKEAYLALGLGRGGEARELLGRAAEIALMVRALLRLRARGAGLVALEDLVKVGEIEGRPVYALKRDSAGRQETA